MNATQLRFAAILVSALALAGCETTGTAPAPASAGAASISTSPVGMSSSTSDTKTETLADGTVRTVTTTSSGGFSFSFNSGTPTSTTSAISPMTYAGRWELKNNFAKSCQLSLGTQAAGQNYQASRSGFCAMGFDKVTAWSIAGNQLFLLDAQGQVRGRLSSDGSGAFVGTYDDGMFQPETVTFRRM